MKTKFAFEKLMEHRKNLEELAMRDYVDAQGNLDRANRLMDRYYDSIEEGRNQVSSLENLGGKILGQLELIESFIHGQKRRIVEHREQVRSIIQDVEKKHETLIERAREYKVLERLKEKQMEKIKKEKKKREMKSVDEMVVMGFGRRKG